MNADLTAWFYKAVAYRCESISHRLFRWSCRLYDRSEGKAHPYSNFLNDRDIDNYQYPDLFH
jgi:hypothetical protein